MDQNISIQNSVSYYNLGPYLNHFTPNMQLFYAMQIATLQSNILLNFGNKNENILLYEGRTDLRYEKNGTFFKFICEEKDTFFRFICEKNGVTESAVWAVYNCIDCTFRLQGIHSFRLTRNLIIISLKHYVIIKFFDYCLIWQNYNYKLTFSIGTILAEEHDVIYASPFTTHFWHYRHAWGIGSWTFICVHSMSLLQVFRNIFPDITEWYQEPLELGIHSKIIVKIDIKWELFIPNIMVPFLTESLYLEKYLRPKSPINLFLVKSFEKIFQLIDSLWTNSKAEVIAINRFRESNQKLDFLRFYKKNQNQKATIFNFEHLPIYMKGRIVSAYLLYTRFAARINELTSHSISNSSGSSDPIVMSCTSSSWSSGPNMSATLTRRASSSKNSRRCTSATDSIRFLAGATFVAWGMLDILRLALERANKMGTLDCKLQLARLTVVSTSASIPTSCSNAPTTTFRFSSTFLKTPLMLDPPLPSASTTSFTTDSNSATAFSRRAIKSFIYKCNFLHYTIKKINARLTLAPIWTVPTNDAIISCIVSIREQTDEFISFDIIKNNRTKLLITAALFLELAVKFFLSSCLASFMARNCSNDASTSMVVELKSLWYTIMSLWNMAANRRVNKHRSLFFAAHKLSINIKIFKIYKYLSQTTKLTGQTSQTSGNISILKCVLVVTIIGVNYIKRYGIRLDSDEWVRGCWVDHVTNFFFIIYIVTDGGISNFYSRCNHGYCIQQFLIKLRIYFFVRHFPINIGEIHINVVTSSFIIERPITDLNHPIRFVLPSKYKSVLTCNFLTIVNKSETFLTTLETSSVFLSLASDLLPSLLSERPPRRLDISLVLLDPIVIQCVYKIKIATYCVTKKHSKVNINGHNCIVSANRQCNIVCQTNQIKSLITAQMQRKVTSITDKITKTTTRAAITAMSIVSSKKLNLNKSHLNTLAGCRGLCTARVDAANLMLAASACGRHWPRLVRHCVHQWVVFEVKSYYGSAKTEGRQKVMSYNGHETGGHVVFGPRKNIMSNSTVESIVILVAILSSVFTNLVVAIRYQTLQFQYGSTNESINEKLISHFSGAVTQKFFLLTRIGPKNLVTVISIFCCDQTYTIFFDRLIGHLANRKEANYHGRENTFIFPLLLLYSPSHHYVHIPLMQNLRGIQTILEPHIRHGINKIQKHLHIFPGPVNIIYHMPIVAVIRLHTPPNHKIYDGHKLFGSCSTIARTGTKLVNRGKTQGITSKIPKCPDSRVMIFMQLAIHINLGQMIRSFKTSNIFRGLMFGITAVISSRKRRVKIKSTMQAVNMGILNIIKRPIIHLKNRRRFTSSNCEKIIKIIFTNNGAARLVQDGPVITKTHRFTQWVINLSISAYKFGLIINQMTGVGPAVKRTHLAVIIARAKLKRPVGLSPDPGIVNQFSLIVAIDHFVKRPYKICKKTFPPDMFDGLTKHGDPVDRESSNEVVINEGIVHATKFCCALPIIKSILKQTRKVQRHHGFVGTGEAEMLELLFDFQLAKQPVGWFIIKHYLLRSNKLAAKKRNNIKIRLTFTSQKKIQKSRKKYETGEKIFF